MPSGDGNGATAAVGNQPAAAWWECRCGQEPLGPLSTLTPVWTRVSYLLPECPFCHRARPKPKRPTIARVKFDQLELGDG